MNRRRVLITGARVWPVTLTYLLNGVLDTELLKADNGALTVVHGACPSGADWFAHRWVAGQSHGRGLAALEEPHPADWDHCDPTCNHRPILRSGRPFCPQAGHRRNQKMVDLDADICHAFVVAGNSRGTMDCVGRARASDILTIEHRVELPELLPHSRDRVGR